MEADRATGRARGRAQGRGRGERGRARARPSTASRPETQQTFQHPQTAPPAAAAAAPQAAAAAPRPTTAPAAPKAAAERGAASSQAAEGPRGDGNPRGGLSRRLSRFAHEEQDYTRPGDKKIGTEGNKIDLVANYIPLRTLYGDDFTAYMFLCDWEPRISPGAKAKFIKQLAGQQEWGGYTCDGRTIFMRKPIHEGTGSDTIHFAFQLPRRDGTELKVTLTMKMVSKVRRLSMEYFHLLNVIFNEGQRRMNLKQIRDDFFNPERFSTVSQTDRSGKVMSTLQVWPGYTAAIGSVDDAQIMLCADVSHKVVATEHLAHTVHKMMTGGSDMQGVRNFVTGRIVYTEYNNRTWRIDDLTFKILIDDTFESKDRQGNVIRKSYRQYYRERYNVELTSADQPLVVTKPKKKDLQKYHRSRKEDIPLEDEIIYLPSEVCILTGLTDKQREDFFLMKELGKYTRQGPRERFTNLNNFATDLKSNQEAAAHFRNWGLEFQSSLLRVSGRVLDNIPIHMCNTKTQSIVQVPHDRPHSAAWDNALRSCGVNPRCSIKSWVAVYGQRDERTANDFFNCLRRVANGLNCDIADPERVAMHQMNALKFAEEGQRRIQGRSLLMFILPRQDANMYNVIKKCFCCDNPIITQCVVSRTIGNPKKVMSVATKVLLQIACKLGYSAWVSPMPPKLQTAMIVGIDVYHKRKQASVQAAVFSYNAEHTQYYSSAIVDTMEMAELNPRIGVQFEQGLKHYSDVNKGRLPDRIIIYRDGVGDSMLSAVKNTEVATIERAVNNRYESVGQPLPNIIFVVVKKRLSTRLVTQRQENPPPGTIVDSVITKPNFCDFFLVSQATRQGTVTPTHYNKIFDNYKEVGKAMAIPTNYLQKLSYLLCHLYYNWPGSIRVPAPTHYAHRLAFLIGQSIGKAPDQRLCDRLFYL